MVLDADRDGAEIIVDRQTVANGGSGVTKARDVTKLGLGRLKPPSQTTSQPPQQRRESVFLHCCFGHHAVVFEGYLFVVFCSMAKVARNVSASGELCPWSPLAH